MKKKITNFSFLISIFFLLSCSGGKNETKESAIDKKKEIENFVEREFTYPIPTAFEVSQMLSNANTMYSQHIVNDPAKVDQYISTWQKATNLGVYGADLSYAATFDKTQEVINYLGVSKGLIDDLNIISTFNLSTLQQIEKNIDNIDSLIYIVTESFYDTYNYLNQNGEEKTSILVIAGSVIEGLHITCELIKMGENKGELMAVLANQKSQVEKLIELMKEHMDDENIQQILPSLRFINLTYDQLGNKTEMTEGQLNDITENVTTIRNEIVG